MEQPLKLCQDEEQLLPGALLWTCLNPYKKDPSSIFYLCMVAYMCIADAAGWGFIKINKT